MLKTCAEVIPWIKAVIYAGYSAYYQIIIYILSIISLPQYALGSLVFPNVIISSDFSRDGL